MLELATQKAGSGYGKSCNRQTILLRSSWRSCDPATTATLLLQPSSNFATIGERASTTSGGGDASGVATMERQRRRELGQSEAELATKIKVPRRFSGEQQRGYKAARCKHPVAGSRSPRRAAHQGGVVGQPRGGLCWGRFVGRKKRVKGRLDRG